MKNINWWSLGVLALATIACDPYTSESKGPLEVLSAFAVAGNSSDNATALFTATGSGPYAIAEVDPGGTVFFVKTNKTLDGAAIQVTPQSCVPAAAVNLAVNTTANPAGWFACYSPSGSTSAEGGSVVIYQGKDITSQSGYFDQANLVNGFYAISATITDKQGHTASVTLDASVRTAPPYVVDVTPTSAVVTWTAGGTRVASYTVERADDVSGKPGPFTAVSGALAPATKSFADPGPLTAETNYWYRIVSTGDAAGLTATSDPVKILTAATPGAPTLAITTPAPAKIAVTWTQVASKVSKYIVERTTTPADPASWEAVGTKAASTATATLTFDDGGTTDVPLVSGTTYHYRIKAAGADYETVPGPEASILFP